MTVSTSIANPVPTRSRGWRWRAAATALVAGALTVAGCGSSAPTEAPEAQTRTVATPNGQVSVPANPQRVVSLNVLETTALLELGVTPVGTPEAPPTTVPAKYRDAYAAIPKIGEPISIDIESVGQQRPDLIVGPYNPQDPNRDEYAKLAPAALGSQRTIVWRERVALAAEAVGKAAEAKQLSDDYDRKHQEFAARHKDLLSAVKVGFVQGYGNGEWYVQSVGTSSGTAALRDAGFQFGTLTGNEEQRFPPYSYEQIEQLSDNDVLLVAADRDGKTLPPSQELVDQPAFQVLPAVKRGNVIPFGYFFINSYTEAQDQLDLLENEVLPKINR